jgi:SAM-dependent methyltransferase
MPETTTDGLPEGMLVRQDESPDALFYREPRFVTHIDDATIAALSAYYDEVLGDDDRVLDLMSSWISHLPSTRRFSAVSGLGMNDAELAKNPVLKDYVVQDLNQNPKLPYATASYDAVLIAVSVQYLNQPFAVFAEIGRILAPGGRCIVAMSHRLFPTKAIHAFHVLAPGERQQLVGAYMASSSAFEPTQALDRSPPAGDPLWLVEGIRADDRAD